MDCRLTRGSRRVFASLKPERRSIVSYRRYRPYCITRHWSTACRMQVMARSTSCSVVKRPRLTRIVRAAACSSSPIALNTCDTAPDAELQADVEEMARSAASMKGKKPPRSIHKLSVCGRCTPSRTFFSTPSIARTPSSSRSLSAEILAVSVSISAMAIAQAVPMPTI